MNCRHYEIVIDQYLLKVDLQSTFMKYTTIKKWAYGSLDKCCSPTGEFRQFVNDVPKLVQKDNMICAYKLFGFF